MSDAYILDARIAVRSALLAVLVSFVAPVNADALDQEINQLKADVATMSRSLFELEEKILHPADTRFSVYLSLAGSGDFILDSIELSLNDQPAVSYLYTDQERQALEQGGIQRLYLGNLPAGEHQVSATFNGQGSNDRYIRNQADFTIRKDQGETQVQLVLEANPQADRPELTLKEWQ